MSIEENTLDHLYYLYGANFIQNPFITGRISLKFEELEKIFNEDGFNKAENTLNEVIELAIKAEMIINGFDNKDEFYAEF